MPHYICVGGCKGVSEESGVCQAENCPEHGHQLKEYDCVDGKHYGAFDTGAAVRGSEEPSGSRREQTQNDVEQTQNVE